MTDHPKTENNPSAQDRLHIPLNRVLGPGTAILLVAGVMIGSGVFKKIAPMAQTGLSESYILLAWIIAGVITMLGAFTYAGLSSLTSRTGGVYEYLRLVFGDFIAFLFGWMIFMIGGSGAIAALAFVFSQSVDTLIHFPEPLDAWKNTGVGQTIFPFASSGIKLFSVLMIVLLTWINCRGVKQGGRLNNLVTAAKILGISFLILTGLFHPSHGTSAELGPPPPAGTFSALFGAMLSALWAYDGWANITYVTGEIKNPQRNIPIAIVCGLGIATLLYVLLNYSFMRVMPLPDLAAVGQNQIAAAEVAGVTLGNFGRTLIAIIIMICTFGALNACIIVYPRVYYRMAQENVFFKKAGLVHPVFRTPYIALIFSAVWSCILVVSGTFDLLTNLIIFSGYLFFGLAAWGVIKMKRNGTIKTKIPLYPVAPVLIILFSAGLIINTFILETAQSLMGIGLVLVGVPFYFYFRKKYAGLERIEMTD